MNRRSKKYLSMVIGAVISVVLVWFLFRNIDFTKLVDALKGANYLWLIPNILIIILTMYQRAYRWKFMIAPIKKVKFEKLLAATCIGFMANNVLPARLGEFVRAYSLSKQDNDISKSASMATIFVERMVFDLMALLLIFGVVITFSESLKQQLETNLVFGDKIIYGVWMAISIAIVGLVFVLILALKPAQVQRHFQPFFLRVIS